MLSGTLAHTPPGLSHQGTITKAIPSVTLTDRSQPEISNSRGPRRGELPISVRTVTLAFLNPLSGGSRGHPRSAHLPTLDAAGESRPPWPDALPSSSDKQAEPSRCQDTWVTHISRKPLTKTTSQASETRTGFFGHFKNRSAHLATRKPPRGQGEGGWRMRRQGFPWKHGKG